MRIDKFKLNTRFKNLQAGFQIDFDESQLITVLVGRNGTGKSNILEALVLIFRDLDLGTRLDTEEKPEFSYELIYSIRGYNVQVIYDRKGTNNSEKYQISVTEDGLDPKSFSINQFSSEPNRKYLPRYLFGYYSGPSNRLEDHFEEHQKNFYRQLLAQKTDEDVPPARPLFYSRLIHSLFALLAFFLEEDEGIKIFLRSNLRVVGLDSVLFIFRTPDWAMSSLKKRKDKFWTATGTVRFFVERLHKYALAPFRCGVPASRIQNDDYFYLYIPDQKTLQNLANEYIDQEGIEGETNFQSFFKALESTYISNLIHEVRINVQIENLDGTLSFRELSEGEQQLLMVLGLMRFTKENESIFLLDEPDTHLNPSWSIQYLEFIRDIVGRTNDSQLIMTTHNPLTLASLKREQVITLHREKSGDILAKIAERDPQGMGIGGILTSDIFGLRSILDPISLTKLDKQRELSIKAEEQQLTEVEKRELEGLNESIGDLDFRNVVRDPLYSMFVKEITEYNKERSLNKPSLSLEEMEEQKSRVKEIIRRLKKAEGEL